MLDLSNADCTDLSNISFSSLQSRLGLHRYRDIPLDYQSYLDRANDEKGHFNGDVCMPSVSASVCQGAEP